MKNDIALVLGAGGGGGDAHTPVDSPNTLLTKTTARVMFLVSDGEISGLADQTNKLKSVFLNNIPAMNADGTLNFAAVAVDERYGLPSQTVVPGFPAISSAFNVSTKVTTTAPAIYTSSTSSVDAIRVTVRFPALFVQQTNGDTTGGTVNFQIYTRLGAGSFSLVNDITKTDKCTSPADVDYLINRPVGAGTWSVKIVRVTADNSATTVSNDIFFQSANELQYAITPYNNRAVIGLTVTAAATGTTYPLVSFDLLGLKVKVPSNYNPITRVYTGTWDGTFAAMKQWTNNPSWVLYDLLTNSTHGMGLAGTDVDQYSFYDAAVYSDGTVPALVGGVISGTEPRYVFNYQLMAQDSAWQTIQNIAASFGAVVYTSGNRAKLVQDRPTGFSRVLTNSNIVDGLFEYSSSQLSTRQSACKVYWNDPLQNYLSVPVYYEDSTGTARYGLSVQTVVGLGITSEGQAMRLAKWHVETSLNNTDAVVFKVGFANAGMEPGEVIKLADTDYAQTLDLEAKIVSSTASTVTFDRVINVTNGTVMDVVGSDGITIFTRTITSSGAQSTVSFSGAAITVSTGADVVFSGAISPRLFKLTDIKEERPGTYMISAVSYDPNKFGRVDTTPTGIVPTFQAPALIPSPVLNLAFREGATNTNNNIQRSLMASWSRPSSGVVKDYLLRYRRALTSWVETSLNTTSFQLDNVLEGQYDFQIFPRSTANTMGPVQLGSYTITSVGGGASLLNSPTGLTIIGGGTAFVGPDINFTFTNPSANSLVASTLKDFEVRFIETVGSTTVRTVYVQSVPAGLIQTSSYTYAMNVADGGSRRSMQLQVRARDSSNNLSNPVTATFTNPTPAAITPTVTGGISQVFVTYTKPTDIDFVGSLVWMSLTSEFTPSAANLVYDGSDSVIPLKALGVGVHYLKFAPYDTFGKDYAGAGLNVTGCFSTSPLASAGIPSGSSAPSTGNEGDLFYNTTDGQLYRYHSGAFTVYVPTSALTGTISNAQIAANAVDATKFASGIEPVSVVSSVPSVKSTSTVFNSADGKLYRWNGTVYAASVSATDVSGTLTSSQIASVSAVSITGSITDSQLAAIAASKITGAIADSQLAAIAASKITGSIVDTQLSAISATKITGSIADSQLAAISAAKITGSIADSQIAAMGAAKLTGTIVDAQIAAMAASKVTGQLVGTQITDGSISTSKIAANAITAAKITAGTITSNEIGAATIVGSNIAGGTITAGNIAASTITTAQLAAGAVTASKIAANTITAGQIAASTITTTQLAAGAVTATNIAAGSISTTKLVVTGSSAINVDPQLQDSSVWSSSEGGSITFQTMTDAPVGTRVIRSGSGTQAVVKDINYYPLDITKKYKVRFWARGVNTNGLLYQDLQQYTDNLGTTCANNGGRSPYKPSGIAIPTVWTEYSNVWGPGDWQAGVKFVRLDWLLNYSGSTGYVELCYPRFEEMVSADLIVDGTITATNILAGTITSTQIAANTITATQIAASTITGSQIAAGTVSANNIAANTITAGQIAAGAITANQIAAGAITSGKLFITGQGKALNDDPGCTDASAWGLGAGSWAVQADTTSPIGSSSIRCTNGTQIYSRFYAIEAGKTYKVSMYAKQVSGGGVMYIRQYSYNSVGSNISYVVSGLTPTTSSFEGLTVPTSWTRYTGYITPAAGCVSANIYLHLNWSTTGVTDITDVRVEEYIGADLIVDGSISATKLIANSITASKIAGSTITGAQIAANTISAGNIVASTITGSQIAANTISAGNIAANTITAGQIAAQTIVASNIAFGTITGGQIASNTIIASNIVSGTITGSQIAANTIAAGNISVASLSALSATIGTLRTATSGARTEIYDNVIKIYDASNVLRVKIGNLAL